MAELTKLESLYDQIAEEGISVHSTHFSDTKKAACMHDESLKAIIIDKPAFKTTSEERTILVEQLARYETNALYFIEATINMPIGRRNRMICEARSKHHAIKEHLSFEELRDAIHSGYTLVYELAEFLNFNEDFIKSAIKYYTENCGYSFNEETTYN